MDGHDKHTKPCGAWKLGLKFRTFGWMGMTNIQNLVVHGNLD
jgi:hypothetical protein